MSKGFTEEIWVREPSYGQLSPTFRRIQVADEMQVTLTVAEVHGLLRLAGYQLAVDAAGQHELEEQM
ncbi:hypothetical protein [Zhihengliuella flava]|uniref:Uncharacterized protein n=1 Tax=Zhihengliuella flava TaxID=1285193 RepID=A0A931DFJ3_9MICC|nr:hypothetical protein [Zhihengliuella flava]MBG6085838.1 hypothetical protein [Zhihengliuella flava]